MPILTILRQQTSADAFGTGAFTPTAFTPTAGKRLLVVAYAYEQTDSTLEGTSLTIADNDSSITSWTSIAATSSSPGWSYGIRAWVSDQGASGSSMSVDIGSGGLAVENYRVFVGELDEYFGIGSTVLGTDADGDGALSLTLPVAPAVGSLVFGFISVTLSVGSGTVTPGADFTELAGEDVTRSTWWILQGQSRTNSTSQDVSWVDINVGATGLGATALAFELLGPVYAPQTDEGGYAFADIAMPSDGVSTSFDLLDWLGFGPQSQQPVTWLDQWFASAGVVTHTTTGALQAQDAALSGTAAHFTLHPTSGALTAQDAALSGAAAHSTLHATSGALQAQDAALSGAAAHYLLHTTSGALQADGAALAGAANHAAAHSTSGALQAEGAALAGIAAHHHATTGALAAEGAALAGSAAHSTAGTHDATGALQAEGAGLAGAAVLVAIVPSIVGQSGASAPRRRRRRRLDLGPEDEPKRIEAQPPAELPVVVVEAPAVPAPVPAPVPEPEPEPEVRHDPAIRLPKVVPADNMFVAAPIIQVDNPDDALAALMEREIARRKRIELQNQLAMRAAELLLLSD